MLVELKTPKRSAVYNCGMRLISCTIFHCKLIFFSLLLSFFGSKMFLQKKIPFQSIPMISWYFDLFWFFILSFSVFLHENIEKFTDCFGRSNHKQSLLMVTVRILDVYHYTAFFTLSECNKHIRKIYGKQMVLNSKRIQIIPPLIESSHKKTTEK